MCSIAAASLLSEFGTAPESVLAEPGEEHEEAKNECNDTSGLELATERVAESFSAVVCGHACAQFKREVEMLVHADARAFEFLFEPLGGIPDTFVNVVVVGADGLEVGVTVLEVGISIRCLP